jgi:RNA polymerase sigma-70 factor, ECF subfamily
MIRELEFQILSQRHCDEIYRFAAGLLGNRADAEDATQEVLLRLWKHLPRLNLFNIRAWLYQTTRNYCLDQIRRRSHGASPNCAVDLDEVLEEWPDDLAVDPSFAADSTFQLEEARRALGRLPETLRSVFLLYEVNGLRYREIAAALGMPINTVKVNLLRARQKLSKLIQNAKREQEVSMNAPAAAANISKNQSAKEALWNCKS